MKSVPVAWFLQFPFVAKIYPSGTTFGDDSYNCPTEDWLINKFYPYFCSELERLGIIDWSKKFDCEDFSAMYKILSQVCHFNSRGTQDGLAVGAIDYTKDSGEYHSINVAFTNVGVIYIEPQSGKPLKLSKNEQNSINRVRI